MEYSTYPFGRAEALDVECAIATYAVPGAEYKGILPSAGAYAVGQSVGTWLPVPGVSQTMVEKRQGRVLGVYDAGLDAEGSCDNFLVRIAFPAANFGDGLGMMLTALMGNDVSTAMRARLVDLEFTPGALVGFSGPAQGMARLRRLAGAKGRPLVLNMIKPCAGFSPEEGAALFRQVALGGVDMVKDDELLASPDYNPVAQRVRAYLAAAEDVYGETGHRTLYLPNISGTPSQMLDNANAVLEAGGRACLVNYVFTGVDALLEVCRRFGEDLFIMAHYAGSGALAGWDGGIAAPVQVGLLPRLAGAHAIMTPMPDLAQPKAEYDFQRTLQMQRLPMGALAPVVTAVGGGVTPVSQAALQPLLGPDSIIGIGGAIQGHPMGATAGAKAAMAAVSATAKGVSLKEAAGECPPLLKALEIWGEQA